MRVQQIPQKQVSDNLLRAKGLRIDTLGGRPLIQNLNLSLGYERAAIMGRNGVGKSSLLHVLAGKSAPKSGYISRTSRSILVPQDLEQADWQAPKSAASTRRRSYQSPIEEFKHAGLPDPSTISPRTGFSRGELRKLHLVIAKLKRPELLLLDEPTQDLDEAGVHWLLGWLKEWTGGLIVVSHDRLLLQQFEHFFIIAESGCRYFSGSFSALEKDLEDENLNRQKKYLQNLTRLDEKEAHNIRVCQRRQQKKRLGRLHELGRATSKKRLNNKRSCAQVSQGRVAKIREDRISQERSWAKSMRRSLEVNLPLKLFIPTFPEEGEDDLVHLEGVSAFVNNRPLFEQLDLKVRRERIAIVGPNGAGKTTLLSIVMGEKKPKTGKASGQYERIGYIAQGAENWCTKDTLLTALQNSSRASSPEDLAKLMFAHKFPLALAERPLNSLSPGERVRAALICLFERAPSVELLILDEPTYGLDFVGNMALRDALKLWPGGLVVVSHDKDFIDFIGVESRLILDGKGGHRYLEREL